MRRPSAASTHVAYCQTPSLRTITLTILWGEHDSIDKIDFDEHIKITSSCPRVNKPVDIDVDSLLRWIEWAERTASSPIWVLTLIDSIHIEIISFCLVLKQSWG